MELLTALEGAVASTAEIVKSTPAGEMGAPTPCTEWDVRALLNHVIGTLWLAEGLFSDQPPRYPIAPGGLPPVDLASRARPTRAYAEASTAALAAAAAGDALTRVHVTPLGEMPGTGLAGAVTLDILVHGWDLAKATGQPTDLDDRLAAHVLGFAAEALPTAESRAGRMAASVPTACRRPGHQQAGRFPGPPAVNPDAALKALAEPNRRAILTLVAGEARPVGDIAGHLDITPQAVSRHLKVLHEGRSCRRAPRGHQAPVRGQSRRFRGGAGVPGRLLG